MERFEAGDLAVCLTKNKDFAGYRLTKALDDEIMRRVYQWLGLNLNVYENTIVFTDGVEYYVAEFPQSAYAVIIHSPRAKRLALEFIHLLEQMGREYVINQTVAYKLALDTGIVAFQKLMERKEEVKREIKRRIQEAIAWAQGGVSAPAKAGESLSRLETAPSAETVVEALCERLRRDEKFREAVAKLAGGL
ncbi:MAG: hypothetical protein QW680_10030 [Pyrobaculum sp.]